MPWQCFEWHIHGANSARYELLFCALLTADGLCFAAILPRSNLAVMRFVHFLSVARLVRLLVPIRSPFLNCQFGSRLVGAATHF
jgi:hypothetical protein